MLKEHIFFMRKPYILEWTIGQEDHGKVIKQFLHEREISKRALTDIKLHGGDIRINGEHVTVRHVLSRGEKLTVQFPFEQKSETLEAEKIPLDILYEDADILIINKPPFMNTIPSREHPTGSVANALMGYYDENEIVSAPHIVTRLDRNTSGLVLVAKHRHVHYLFSKAQQQGRVTRVYEAIVEGVLNETNGIIEAPIARKRDSIIEREVNENGQFARTRYEIIRQYQDYAHIKLKLDTGRTHQIRVHMSYLGHPLIGDDLYGGSTTLLSRQALHCKYIRFVHPILKKELSFSCPLPEDMRRLIEK
jgi:23S rRNA pseudouridine1911/1915/1917 synthase